MPIDHVSSSPAEILLGRKIHDNLPQRFSRKPEADRHYQRLHERQEEQKRSFGQHIRPPPLVVPGQSVNVCCPLTSRSEAGKVTDGLSHRSNEVNLDKGSRIRRNRFDTRESSVSRQPEATVSSPVRTREESKSSSTHEPEVRTTPDSSYATRSGRVVKQLVKLD